MSRTLPTCHRWPWGALPRFKAGVWCKLQPLQRSPPPQQGQQHDLRRSDLLPLRLLWSGSLLGRYTTGAQRSWMTFSMRGRTRPSMSVSWRLKAAIIRKLWHTPQDVDTPFVLTDYATLYPSEKYKYMLRRESESHLPSRLSVAF